MRVRSPEASASPCRCRPRPYAHGDNTLRRADILQAPWRRAPGALARGRSRCSNGATISCLNAGMTVTMNWSSATTRKRTTRRPSVKGGARTLTAPLTYQNPGSPNDKATLTLAGGLVQAAGTSGETFTARPSAAKSPLTNTPCPGFGRTGAPASRIGLDVIRRGGQPRRQDRFKEVAAAPRKRGRLCNAPRRSPRQPRRHANGGRLTSTATARRWEHLLTPGTCRTRRACQFFRDTRDVHVHENATDVAKRACAWRGAFVRQEGAKDVRRHERDIFRAVARRGGRDAGRGADGRAASPSGGYPARSRPRPLATVRFVRPSRTSAARCGTAR